MTLSVRRYVVVVVLLLAATVCVLARGNASARDNKVEHTCGLNDREFLSNYQVQIESVGMYGDDYLSGKAKATDVISVSRQAAKVVKGWTPYDPSLKIVHRYAPAMFDDYADAVKAREQGEDAGRAMYLAYQIGARIQDTLREAEPDLAAAGCDVSDLL